MTFDIPLIVNSILAILFRIIEIGGVVAITVLVFKCNKKLNTLLKHISDIGIIEKKEL